MTTIAVYCGSRTGNDPIYMKEAAKLGEVMVKHGVDLVYGGSKVGCMGAVADAVLAAGGKVIGILPEKLASTEIAHEQLTELYIVKDMHVRKARMAEYADAFIALPGGPGTMEEWFEVFTWSQIGYHHKPCALLNINNYYSPLVSLFDHMIGQGFTKPGTKESIVIEDEPEPLIRKILHYLEASQ